MSSEVPTPAAGWRVSTRTLLIVGVVITLLLAGLVSFFASSSPDGLAHVAETLGFSSAEKPHHSADSPLAGYEVSGVSGSKGLAGVAGVVVVAVVMSVVIWLVRRSGRSGKTD